MSKLTKAEMKAHQQACEILTKSRLNTDEKIFVLKNWNEGANHVNGAAGAFFTPTGLARDFSVDAGGGNRVIDLCAGIGGLGFWLSLDRRVSEIVCVEINPDYIEVGRKILPDATWIQADVFNLPDELKNFDLAISNPPFGSTPRKMGRSQRYTGNRFEYHVIDIASDIAQRGTFIIPQNSAPFVYSGSQIFSIKMDENYKNFNESTNIELEPGCGVDTSFYFNDWHGVKPMCEVVNADFSELHSLRIKYQTMDLFAIAA